MTTQEIAQVQEAIEDMLKDAPDPANPIEVRTKLAEISAYIGNCGICITWSKQILMIKRSEWLRAHTDKIKDMSPTQSKEFINTACIDEAILAQRCEMNYDALKRSGDMLVSVLSHFKAEMQFNNHQQDSQNNK